MEKPNETNSKVAKSWWRELLQSSRMSYDFAISYHKERRYDLYYVH